MDSVLSIGVGCATVGLLLIIAPDGIEPHYLAQQFVKNMSDLRHWNVAYPPLLVYGTLSACALLVWRDGDSIPRRFWLFALASLVPHALLTNFQEVRAQLGSMVCMIPLAVAGLQSVGRPVQHGADKY
jgi:hypothetical protein